MTKTKAKTKTNTKTNTDRLEDARRKKKALEGAGATTTLRRLEYATALREVAEHRAFADEGYDDYSAWAEEALGLQRAQASAYLAAALVPPALLQGRDFDLDALALLGRVSQRPEIQRELAAGIQRVGLVAARRAWTRLRHALCGTAEARERIVLQLRSALEEAATNAARREAKQQRSGAKHAVRVIMNLLMRHSTGEALAPGEQRMLVDLFGYMRASPLLHEAGGARGGVLPHDEKLNDFKKEGSSEPEFHATSPHMNQAAEVLPSAGAAPAAAGQERGAAASATGAARATARGPGEAGARRAAADRADDGPGEDDKDDKDDEDDEDDDGYPEGYDADDLHREYCLADPSEDGPRRLDDDPADEAPPLSPEAAVAALTAGLDEARRAGVSGALACLVAEGFPDSIERGQRALRWYAAEASRESAGELLRAWVNRATEPDIERRFPLVFPALLLLDDSTLPRALWSLCSARLPPHLLDQVCAASEARRWPPLPEPGDAVGLAALESVAEAAAQHFKSLPPG